MHVTASAGMERAKVAAEALSQRLESEAAAGLKKVKASMGARLQRAEEDTIEAEARALEAEDRAQAAQNKASETERALAETLASLGTQVASALSLMPKGVVVALYYQKQHLSGCISIKQLYNSCPGRHHKENVRAGA